MSVAAACARDVTTDVEVLADRACACRDAACGRAALDELVAVGKRSEPPRGDEARASAAAKRMAACLVTLGVSRDELIDAIKRVRRE